jgi:hypothetical protein
MNMKSDRKLVSFRLPEDLMSALREKADTDGISVTELVCRFLQQGLQASMDDRIATLEAEIRSLKQSHQTYANVIPTPMYLLAQPEGATSEGDRAFKQQIAALESTLESMLEAKLESKFESMLELLGQHKADGVRSSTVNPSSIKPSDDA